MKEVDTADCCLSFVKRVAELASLAKKWIAKCANCKMKKKFSAFHPKSPAKTQTSIGENKQELHYVHPKTFGADRRDLPNIR